MFTRLGRARIDLRAQCPGPFVHRVSRLLLSPLSSRIDHVSYLHRRLRVHPFLQSLASPVGFPTRCHLKLGGIAPPRIFARPAERSWLEWGATGWSPPGSCSVGVAGFSGAGLGEAAADHVADGDGAYDLPDPAVVPAVVAFAGDDGADHCQDHGVELGGDKGRLRFGPPSPGVSP